MMARCLIAALAAAIGATPVASQIPDVVDPNTGNYVAGRDPLYRYDAAPSRANPARLGRSIVRRLGRPGAPPPDAAAGAGTALTPGSIDASLKYPAWWPK